MSKAKEDAKQRAFEEGQTAQREGKSIDENKYPPEAREYRDYWEQGWQAEHDIHYK